ncbi:MAG: Gfo/Idh/MocA family oxidoreductase [Deltaproteobacteria bacterium]|nr:Gfo/Idh/MocA family oxidoreductase [Deltaproteobacteria bacterium]
MSQQESKMNRRQLLKTTAAIGGAAIVGPFFPGRVLGANDRVNVAVIGIRGQGGAHITNYIRQPNVQLKTLCDIDENLFATRIKKIHDEAGYAPGTEWEMRKVFEDKDIHAVSFAIPNHWHALATIWAAQAGKHVYVEKPCCQTIFEGRQMVHAARQNKVLVQAGFQNRSRNNTRAAIEYLHSGKLGKVYMAKGLCLKARADIGRYPDGPMPEGSKFRLTTDGEPMEPFTSAYLEKVHYDNWMGPAPVKPFNPNRFHYNWHWQWDYGNGDTGNQGPHQFDVGRWGLNKDEYPVKISSKGGYYLFDSMQETPNTQTTLLEYADGTLFQFETRGWYTNADGTLKIGNIFYGKEGRLEIDGEGNWKTYFGRKDELGPDSSKVPSEERSDAGKHVGTGMGGHFSNFISAVRSGKQTDLNCDIESGFRSSVLPALGNIAYRMGTDLIFDGKTESFKGNAKANAFLHRKERKGYAIPRLGKTGIV